MILEINFFFSNKFDSMIVYVFNLELLEFKKKIIRSNPFFFEICDFNFYIKKLFTFFLNFHYFPHFFTNKNCQVRKIQNQENMLIVWTGGGG